VILGDYNAGRDYPEQEIFQDGEAALDLLETAFTPAYTPDYLLVPQCTFCITNPVREPGAEDTSNWIDHIHLYNLPATSVVSTKRTFDQDLVPVPAGGGGAGGSGGAGGAGGGGGAGGAGVMLVPLSDHFGIQSRIRVP